MASAIAILTYNQVDGIQTSGWIEKNGRRALVIQGDKAWGAGQAPEEYTHGEGDREKRIKARSDTIERLWADFAQISADFDQVFIYLGTKGSERAVQLASCLAAERVTFVACTCGLERKEALVQMAGLGACGRIVSSCGGHATLAQILNEFFEMGRIPNFRRNALPEVIRGMQMVLEAAK